MPSAMREGGRLVVVGGDAAGMSAASRARRLRPDIDVVVLEQGLDVSYAACSLPYYIADLVTERDQLVRYDADFFRRERHIDVRLGTRAVALDAKRRSVTCEFEGAPDGEVLEFDALVIATGARAVRLPLPGVELDGVFTLRTLTDGERIKRFLGSGHVRTATIVGGGYIGLEMAEALCARDVAVTVVECQPDVLSTFDPDMSSIVEEELLAHNVILHKGRKAEGFELGDDPGRVGYILSGGQRVATDLVIVSAGVRPTTDLAESGGIALGPTGAIRADARQVTSEPSVLAAGDCCEAKHVVTRRPAWIPLGTTANKQGKIAGENAVGGNVQFGGIAGTNVTKVFDLEVAQTGLTAAGAAEEGHGADSVRIKARTRPHGYPGGQEITVKLVFEKRGGRLLGGQIIGRERVAKRIDTIATALHAGMTVGDLAQVDMSYAPPFAPVWDPILIAAGQAVKKVAG